MKWRIEGRRQGSGKRMRRKVQKGKVMVGMKRCSGIMGWR